MTGWRCLAEMHEPMQATLSDALAVLKSSPMIFALCLMVISYGVGHRLFEFAWKGQLRMQYPSALAYQVCFTLCMSFTQMCHVCGASDERIPGSENCAWRTISDQP